jgi:paraquat-inducible protein B
VTRPSPTALGVFVLGALALIVVGILFFGGGALLTKRLPAVTFFQDSVAGLQIGAAVTFRGVQVGRVKSIGIRVDPDTYRTIIQVDMQLLPDRVAVYGSNLPLDEKLVPALVERGLTAKLVKQSFVTGILNVELNLRPGAAAFRAAEGITVPEVPSVPSEFGAITKKLEDLDFGAVLDSMQRTLASLDRILTSPELNQTIRELPALTTQLRQTLKTVDGEVAALSGVARVSLADSTSALQKTMNAVQTLAANLDREVGATATAARGTLDRANTAIEGANALVDPRGRTAIQVQRAVDDLAATAARLRNLAERVDRDPSILIRGR